MLSISTFDAEPLLSKQDSHENVASERALVVPRMPGTEQALVELSSSDWVVAGKLESRVRRACKSGCLHAGSCILHYYTVVGINPELHGMVFLLSRLIGEMAEL